MPFDLSLFFIAFRNVSLFLPSICIFGSIKMAEAALNKLQELVEVDMPPAEPLKDALNNLASEVKAGGPTVREEILGKGAYEAVIKAWSLICYGGLRHADLLTAGSPPGGDPAVKLFTPEAKLVREATLTALYTLTAGFPEIINDLGWVIIEEGIDLRMPETTQTLAMKVIRNICIKSEANRERISWESKTMMEGLVLLIKRDEGLSPEFVREWCGAMKTLILSDDTRVAYNRAPERKLIIHNLQTLPILTQHLYTFEGDEGTLNALIVLLGSMAVNENMCIAIESANVFPAFTKIFKTFPQNKMLMKNAISFLRYLNISATVRQKCNAFGLVKWVLQLMLQYKNCEDVLEVGLSCLAFMTLRDACHTAQFMVAQGVPILIEIMEIYKEKIPIMKGGCLTLRNVAANGGAKGRASILDKGAEEFLRNIQEKFPDLRENYVKPALRDLGVLKDDELGSEQINGQDQGPSDPQSKKLSLDQPPVE